MKLYRCQFNKFNEVLFYEEYPQTYGHEAVINSVTFKNSIKLGYYSFWNYDRALVKDGYENYREGFIYIIDVDNQLLPKHLVYVSHQIKSKVRESKVNQILQTTLF